MTLFHNDDHIINAILQGAIFIYPTDTIYGIGCDARHELAIATIRKLKKRPTQPFSVIAPSLRWIRDYCDIPFEAEKWLSKLPGPYSLILKVKQISLASNLHPNTDCIGVRIPDHWISTIVKTVGFPIVTTSVNTHGNPPMTCIADMEEKFHDFYCIDDGILQGNASTIVDCRNEITILKR